MTIAAAPGSAASGPSTVRAVQRAVELLLAVADHPEGMPLRDLAAAARVSKSTAHRLLSTLEELQVVEREPASRRYLLGPRARRINAHAPPEVDPRQVALPRMLAVRDACGETVSLHIRSGTSHVVLDQCESREEVRRILPLGQPVPLLVGATARAILAFLPPDERERVLQATRTQDQSGPSDEELNQIRSVGYSVSEAERISGGVAASAPIYDRWGSVWGALSISGPAFRFKVEDAQRCAPTLVKAASAISLDLGYAPGVGPHQHPNQEDPR